MVISRNLCRTKIQTFNYCNRIVDNMPITWCYDVEGEKKFCTPGFPIGCFVNDKGRAKDACVISPAFSSPNTVYMFNHVEITLEYHQAGASEWGTGLPEDFGRLISAKLIPKRSDLVLYPKAMSTLLYLGSVETCSCSMY